MSFKSTGYVNAQKVRHGDWRDDRPPPWTGPVEHPRMDWLRVGESMPWQACASRYQPTLIP
ncbi:hypothetical protein [Shewanella sp. M-Br]|uniref:hypothetical protein n=1 Tax=Shewanella sp. M-Br TaxID=2495595 RepID=UPI0030C78139